MGFTSRLLIWLVIGLLLGLAAAYGYEWISASPATWAAIATQSSPEASTAVLTSATGEVDPAKPDTSYDFNEADLKRFHSWIQQTIDETVDSGSCAVIIDKAAYRLYLIQRGEISAGYPIELGFNPIDDKQMEGDGTTPEGMYWTVDKRDQGQTVFYRGFLINYPDQQDQEEFRQLKANGDVPQSATIGGGIMLHGLGSGKPGNQGGTNWTLGCISLSNADIDELFPLLTAHTRLTIVRYSELPGWLDERT